MASFKKNHYILIIQNNYTREARVFDVTNISDDPKFYEFEFEFPDDLPYGEYNYWLVCDELDYEIPSFSNDMLDTVIDVTGKDGKVYSIKLSDLCPDTGIIRYADSNGRTEQSIDERVEFYSL